ncbi:MAG: hypothetical protein PHT97_10875 [Methanoculleus sp.]|uniref:hypothetical protein n=1 Tax=Methanoculleus sp. TaxID=90427 RepID=UPI0026061BE0|nr:hypothetical protein [Methanoculleus sp.]MDD4471644.1 hypothetical protein [Methanoculleus sp.]
MVEGCVMCDREQEGRKWKRDILMGLKTPRDAANYFNMDIEQVNDHLAEHDYMTDDEKLLYESKDFYVRELAKIYTMLQDWLKYVIGAETISKQDIDIGLKLTREVRETVVKLAEFQGRLDKSAGSVEKMLRMEKKYIVLTSEIVAKVCPECQLKVLEVIHDLK